MNNSVCKVTMANLRTRVDEKFVSKRKDYLKWIFKPSYMSHKIFDNDLVGVRKNKVTSTLNKPAYIGLLILELGKELMYEFHYDYINKYCNDARLLFTDTDSLMYEIKSENVYEDFSNDKEMIGFSNYSTKSKYYDNSNSLVIGKMKDETAGVVIEEFVRLQLKMYLYLADDISDHKKAKGANKNTAATISHNKYKDVLLNENFLRNSMNRIQSKEQHPMKSTKFYGLVLMTKYFLKTMDIIDQLLGIRIKQKKQLS